MNWISFIAGIICGAVIGGLATFILRTRLSMRNIHELEAKAVGSEKTVEEIRRQLQEKEDRIIKLSEMLMNEQGIKVKAETQLEEARKNLEEQKEMIEDASQKLKDTFDALSAEALKSNNHVFLELAQSSLEKYMSEAKGDLENRKTQIDLTLKPLKEVLQQYNKDLKDLEASRQEAYGGLRESLKNMKTLEEQLQKETSALVGALKSTSARGRYGEIGLKRVVEFAGLSEFCDFEEQASRATDEGRIRPDLVIHLPGKKSIIIDSKVPLSAYMQAFETNDEEKKKIYLTQHAKAVKEHLKKLGSKEYWNQFKDAPDYVVLYMQIESSFAAALETDHTLIEEGYNNQVMLATPTTLITLLRTVAYRWQQEKITENAKKIWETGVELFNRVSVLLEYLSSIGKNLQSATEDYNKAVSSLETRFLPQVRKLKDLVANQGQEIPEINNIETHVRALPDIDNKA